MNDSSETAGGTCLCGAVTYDVNGPLRDVIECHCETCRRMSGGLWHGSAAMADDIEIHDQEGALTWYRSSKQAQRGFCNTCGSTLFYRRDGGDRISIAAGSLNKPTGIKIGVRIFTDSAADYGTWQSDVPTFETWPPAEYFNVPKK